MGCAPRPGEVEPPWAEPEDAEDAALIELLDSLDPGPQPALIDDLPDWMFDLLGLEARPTQTAEELLAASAREQASYDELLEGGLGDPARMVMAIRALARAVALAEQGAAADGRSPAALARLERAYLALDIPMFAGGQNGFTQFTNMFLQAAAAEEAISLDAQRAQATYARVQSSVAAAQVLHRRVTVELARAAPKHEALPEALMAEAGLHRANGEAWPVELATMAMQRRGSAATPEQQLELARVCYASLELACGDSALAAARNAEGIDGVRKEGKVAARIVALADAQEFEPRLERARAQIELGRLGPARSEFEALRAQAPRDARPVAGLAKLKIEESLDFLGANAILEEAGPLENGDVEYYEISIGVRASAAVASVLPKFVSSTPEQVGELLRPLAEDMRRDAAALAALGNEDGRFLVFVFDIAQRLLDQFLAGEELSLDALPDLTDRVAALQRELPRHDHSYRLLMSATLFEHDLPTATRAVQVAAPSGPEAEALEQRRVRAVCDLATAWSDVELARACAEGASSQPPASELGQDAALIAAQLGAGVQWGEVAARHESALSPEGSARDARHLNNLGLAMWKVGAREAAMQAWSVAATSDDDHRDVPALNLMIAQAEPGSPESRSALQSFTTAEATAGVRLTALTWFEAWAESPRERKLARDRLRGALEAERAKKIRAPTPDPHSGLVLEGALQLSLGYATQEGLQIELDASGRPWGILTPEG